MQQQNQSLNKGTQGNTISVGEWNQQEKEAFLIDLRQRSERVREANMYNQTIQGGTLWTAEEVGTYMIIRSEMKFGRKMVIDQNNRNVFNLLCYYFSLDQRFYELANAMQVKEPDINKGILLAGNVGTGKSFLMSLFRSNFRQPFKVINAKRLANAYEEGGQELITGYLGSMRAESFYDDKLGHQCLGLCIDDLGTEDPKVYMGNRKNVIGDIIEHRYENRHVGHWLHVTTNLLPKEIDEYYGARVGSRLRQVVNLIEFSGDDRRKTVSMFPTPGAPVA